MFDLCPLLQEVGPIVLSLDSLTQFSRVNVFDLDAVVSLHYIQYLCVCVCVCVRVNALSLINC